MLIEAPLAPPPKKRPMLTQSTQETEAAMLPELLLPACQKYDSGRPHLVFSSLHTSIHQIKIVIHVDCVVILLNIVYVFDCICIMKNCETGRRGLRQRERCRRPRRSRGSALEM